MIDDPAQLDAGFVGVPFDNTTSNRSGARFGPRQIRAESPMVRPGNVSTGASPFDGLAIADLGDVPINPYNPADSFRVIETFFDRIVSAGCKPVAMGGDHTVTLPILRAIAKRHGPVAMVHVDAHADLNDRMFGEAITHGTWVRRAVEESLIDPTNTVQIGLRGTGYSVDDFDWPREQGFMLVPAEACWYRSLAPLMAAVRDRIGPETPVYLTFDIDGLDQADAPGTGAPEPGGLNSIQGLEIIRGCRGLNLVGADLVEVAPPYDPSGNTALLAANLLFEMLCVLPGVPYRDVPEFAWPGA
jgi:guanidinobutyrase